MTRPQAVLAVAAFALLQLDGTIGAVAAPTVATHGHITPGVFVAAFFVAYAATLLPAGRLVDAFGSRPALLAGLAIFASGALLTAVQPVEFVEVARAVQGIGAGLVSPAALSQVARSVEPARRGRALGVWGAVTGIASLAGPLAGGAVTALAGWRANWFLLAAGAGAIGVLALGLTTGPPGAEHGPPESGRASFGGAGLSGLAFAILVGGSLLLEEQLQRDAGWGPASAGLALALLGLPFAAAARSGGIMADRHGELVVAGAAALASGAALVLAAAGPAWALALSVATCAAGLGVLVPAASRAALAAERGALGQAASRLSFARLLGAGAGAAAVDVLAGVSPNVATAGLAVALLAAGLPLTAIGLRSALAGSA